MASLNQSKPEWIEQELISCECGDLDHVIKLGWIEGDKDEEDILWIEARPYRWQKWWKHWFYAFRAFWGLNNSKKDGILGGTAFRIWEHENRDKVLSRYTDEIDHSRDKLVLISEDGDNYLVFEHDGWDENNDVDWLDFVSYMEPVLSANPFSRAWRLLKFLFGYSSKYGDVDYFELSPEEAAVLRGLSKRHYDYYGEQGQNQPVDEPSEKQGQND